MTAAENARDQALVEVERLRAVVALYVEYEAFLFEANQDPVSNAYAHGWRCSEADVLRGQEFRDRIAALATPPSPKDGEG